MDSFFVPYLVKSLKISIFVCGYRETTRSHVAPKKQPTIKSDYNESTIFIKGLADKNHNNNRDRITPTRGDGKLPLSLSTVGSIS